MPRNFGGAGRSDNTGTFLCDYLGNSNDESAAIGFETAVPGVLKIKVSATSEVTPVGTAQFTIDSATNGDIEFTPNGSGFSLFNGEVRSVTSAANTGGFRAISSINNLAIPAALNLQKDINGSAVTANQNMGSVSFRGYDGSNYIESARIEVDSVGTIGVNRVPGNISFLTLPDNAAPTLMSRMAIQSAGTVVINPPDSGVGLTISGGGISVVGGTSITGTTNINSSGSAATTIGAGTNSGTVTIGNTSSGAVTIGSGTAGISVGTTANAHASTFGSVTSTSSTTIQSGSGALAVTSTNGTLTINSGTGALGISTDASATAVSIATGGAVKTTILGSTNSTSATTVQSGSGACNLGTTGTGATNIGNTTGTTTIQFGASSALSDYKTGTFTPTLDGGTPGLTTYTTQLGYYIKIGSLVWVNILVNISAATGTGDAFIGGLPYTVSSATSNSAKGSVIASGAWAWPAGATMLQVNALSGTTTCVIPGVGSTVASARLQMTNATYSISATVLYSI